MAELTPEQRNLTPEELKKDVLLRAAEAILKEIDPSFELEWVKKDPKAGEVTGFLQAGPQALPGLGRLELAPRTSLGFRRIIQMNG
jgi:hypothetical protein